jgi:chlorophyllase
MDFTLSYNATHEIRDAIHVLKWIQANIECALSVGLPETKPDLSKLALVGHSRGGKVVFSMGIQLNGTIPISTIIGLDPVDGDRQGIQIDPAVLTFKENTLNMTVPTLIVGTRSGSENWPLFPPCAPQNVSHNEFYKDLIEPVYHFVVAKESGHMDFLDDAVCELTRLECMGTVGSRARMSRFAGGVVAAFLQAIAGNNPCYFNYALTNYTSAPVILEVPEQKGELPHNHNLQVPLKDE